MRYGFLCAGVNTGGRRRASTSYILLLDASNGAGVDSLPYTEMIVSNPLVRPTPGAGVWDVYCGTEHGSIRLYRVEGGHVSLSAQRVLGRDWVWPVCFVEGNDLVGAFIVGSADHHSYILDGELSVLLNRTGLEGAPITPLASFAGAAGDAYVAFLCHGSDVCVDRVVADSGWSVRKWLLLGYLVPLAGLALATDRIRTALQRFSL
jgi:hypothetical protein